MTEKEILLKLLKIAQRQQKVLEKLAQAQTAAPPADGATLVARLLEEAKKTLPNVADHLMGPLQILDLNNPNGIPVVSGKFRSGPDSANFRKAIDTAAAAVLGPKKYRLDLTGAMG